MCVMLNIAPLKTNIHLYIRRASTDMRPPLFFRGLPPMACYRKRTPAKKKLLLDLSRAELRQLFADNNGTTHMTKKVGRVTLEEYHSLKQRAQTLGIAV
jgi:hypothetical protein